MERMSGLWTLVRRYFALPDRSRHWPFFDGNRCPGPLLQRAGRGRCSGRALPKRSAVGPEKSAADRADFRLQTWSVPGTTGRTKTSNRTWPSIRVLRRGQQRVVRGGKQRHRESVIAGQSTGAASETRPTVRSYVVIRTTGQLPVPPDDLCASLVVAQDAGILLPACLPLRRGP